MYELFSACSGYHGSAPAPDHLYLTNIAAVIVPSKCVSTLHTGTIRTCLPTEQISHSRKHTDSLLYIGKLNSDENSEYKHLLGEYNF